MTTEDNKQELYLHNTLSREKELFIPIEKDIVKIYHCGPTVYWNQHIGNLRAVVIVDIVKRVLEYNNYKVNLVRNYTDVGHLTGDNIGDADSGEDRMMKASKRENLTPDMIADKYISIYENDIKLLNADSADNKPRATKYIDEMIKMIEELIEKGFAYNTQMAIYMDTSKVENYTKLSHQKIDFQNIGAGHGSESDNNKKNPSDFALWFFKTGAHINALQYWSSPFVSPLVQNGEGFPGWHIECSAMIRKLLGIEIDIHIGGIEHIPIHHTNEIAQSESANSHNFVRYWLHNEHLLIDNKKMSKSEGTSYLLKDIIDKGYNPLVLRYFFAQAHYRSKQNMTWESLEASNVAYNKLKNNIQKLKENILNNNEDTLNEEKINKYKNDFLKNINNDFNIPAGLAVIWTLLKDKELNSQSKLYLIEDFDRVLGIL